MSTRRTDAAHAPWLGAGILALAVAAACAPKAARRQTDVMETSGRVRVSAADLRSRVNTLADRIADELEGTADRIRAENTDEAVRRRALAFKVDAVPAAYIAGYRADPLEAAIDVWGFAYQLVQYMEVGEGRDAFGSSQGMALESARGLRGEADQVMAEVVARPEHFAKGRVTIEEWAARHPVQHTFAARPAATGFAAQWRSQGRDAFIAVGELSETLDSVSERLNTYAAQLPKLARWQAELLVSEQAERKDVQAALADVAALGSVARRAQQLMEDSSGGAGAPGSPVRDLLAAEREIVLGSVDVQRRETLAYMTNERLAVVAALRQERLETLVALRQERIETLQEVDAIKSRAVASAVVGLREVIDHALLRVALMLAVALVLAAALGVVGYRLTVARA